jgi:nitrate/TMAO reductase-like tetraheme cytochrome c subunit/mono/diheme cytochrome c family protein
MKRIINSINRFFFPPAGSPRWMRILPYALLGVLTLLVLTASAYGWEYTNSPPFCGETCHTMPPEYTAYLTSPHARVACVDCHIGKGFIATRITRKAGDLKHVYATLFKDYEFPIVAHDLRPSRETCELCHNPEKFSDDSLREIKRYGVDENNTPYSIYLTLKTGGGSTRSGLGKGIHWHIENNIEFLSTDGREQSIPYVRVTDNEGKVTEYVELGSGVDPANVDPAELEQMDCITCHNRITHLVNPPEDVVDTLMANGIISSEIPEIRKKAVEVYSQPYASVEMGLNGIAGLESYYSAYHPDYYSANKDQIHQAIIALQDAYRQSVYPEQKSDWKSHPNNVGHKDSPGCFRCHDGEHINASGETIRLECNLCHSIPVVAGPNDFVADIEISRGPEPETHRNPNWIHLHNQVFDGTCANCHTIGNPGGTDNTSFCSNSACHGNVWQYAGFDAPGLRQTLLDQIPTQPTPVPLPEGGPLTYTDTIGPLFQARCGQCHASNAMVGLDLTSYSTALSGSQNGPVIVPGDAEKSLLIQKQSGEQPHFGQLSPEELELVTQWINAGAPEK